MNVDIDARDNHPFVAIMALPTERVSCFDVEKLLKAQNTVSYNTPDMTAQCALASEAFKKIEPICYPGRNKAAAMVASLPAFTNTLSDCDDNSLLRYF
jgi:hypothetical protein